MRLYFFCKIILKLFNNNKLFNFILNLSNVFIIRIYSGIFSDIIVIYI